MGLPEKSLKPKYFGDNANRASRDWSDKNHRSGAHVSQAGHRMLNQDQNDKKGNRRNRNKNRENSQKPEKLKTPIPSEPNFTDLELNVIKNMRLSAKNKPNKNQAKKKSMRRRRASSSSSSDSSEYDESSSSSSSSSDSE